MHFAPSPFSHGLENRALGLASLDHVFLATLINSNVYLNMPTLFRALRHLDQYGQRLEKISWQHCSEISSILAARSLTLLYAGSCANCISLPVKSQLSSTTHFFISSLPTLLDDDPAGRLDGAVRARVSALTVHIHHPDVARIRVLDLVSAGSKGAVVLVDAVIVHPHNGHGLVGQVLELDLRGHGLVVGAGRRGAADGLQVGEARLGARSAVHSGVGSATAAGHELVATRQVEEVAIAVERAPRNLLWAYTRVAVCLKSHCVRMGLTRGLWVTSRIEVRSSSNFPQPGHRII